MVSKHYEDEMIDIERGRLEIYSLDVTSATIDRKSAEEFRNKQLDSTKESINTYNNMYAIIRLQTYLMVLQSVIFACILFSI